MGTPRIKFPNYPDPSPNVANLVKPRITLYKQCRQRPSGQHIKSHFSDHMYWEEICCRIFWNKIEQHPKHTYRPCFTFTTIANNDKPKTMECYQKVPILCPVVHCFDKHPWGQIWISHQPHIQSQSSPWTRRKLCQNQIAHWRSALIGCK